MARLESWVEFDAYCVRETDMAILVDIAGEEIWIPRSVIADPDDWFDGANGELEIKEWWAFEKGLI